MRFYHAVANNRGRHCYTDSSVFGSGERLSCFISTIKLRQRFVVVECNRHAIQIS
jgi:hypothetical protein